jgi:bifunctional non-homologous end joining protein LigD
VGSRIAPTLCLLTKEIFDHPDWIFEPKYDGIRCLLFFDGKRVRLMSRNRKELNHSYPEIVKAAAGLARKPFVADGEIVVGEGSSFEKLQQRMGVRAPTAELLHQFPCRLYLFDLLEWDGEDLRSLPLLERKKMLSKLKLTARVRKTPVHKRQGTKYFQEMCRKGFEGVVGKDARSSYSGRRDGSWRKFKCQNRQEFLITGYTEPKGSRTGFGALLVGYYHAGKLLQAGRVGTGFSQDLLERLHRRLSKLKQDKQGVVTWVKPTLVCEVEFTEWTRDGKLRHPSFVGLRRDKRPRDVVREG